MMSNVVPPCELPCYPSSLLDFAGSVVNQLTHEQFSQLVQLLNQANVTQPDASLADHNATTACADDVNAETCKYCHTSRWKPEKKSNTDHTPTTKHMRWHAEDDNKDGTLRHPRYGEAWKKFDTTFPEFSSDPRNVRLGLAGDDFNPFGTMSSSHSIWPVILVPYNLPPWLCMKQPNFILSMIIPGLRAPGNNIDVYLQPFIKELKELWSDGVDTFDKSKNEVFRMRAALMWTVSDFLGLDSLSGWNTHTGLACPSCNFDAEPCRLPHSRKWCFIGHRRFLSRNHKFRMMRHHFDGTVEERTPPKKLSGSYIFRQVKYINVTFGRLIELNRKRKLNKQRNDDEGGTQQWRKKSIFFDLPYWESNLLRHNLDVMHIEKNVFDNIIYTLVNDKEKSKDHIKARKDLQDMGIWRDLWPNENGECRLGAFTIPKKKKLAFLKTLKNILVPDCYAIDEVKQRRPVHYRWMYFVERLLGHFKSLVRNKSQLEGSIAEGHKVEEVLTLDSRYFDEIRLRLNRPKRVNDEPNHNEASGKSSMFPQQGKPVGGSTTEPLTTLEKTQAH
ncbi:hypothetical protein MTR67_038677 [Solanum verrucosum]|uniref:DUF4218 domain-containing protein n=1 Tax=Solanum verrucosum TaxID=315347 RepID=A0AAF0UFW1_SOLVR|nr:hypothetical protein MTR67_038677 [Solanum verrucosum]